MPATTKKQYFKDDKASHPRTATKSNTGTDDEFYPSSKIQLLHQRTSLSLAFDRSKGWGYQGETALYVIVDNSVDGGASLSSAAGENATNNNNDKAKTAGSSAANNNNNKDKPAKPLGVTSNGTLKPISLALNLRDGCYVESVNVYGAATHNTNIKKQPETNVDSMEIDTDEPTTTNSTSLHPLPHHTVSFAHHDPLSVVLTRPPSLHSVEDDGVPHFTTSTNNSSVDGDDVVEAKLMQSGTNKLKSSTTRRYEADAHATRGTKGMIQSIRAASIASALGELRLTITPDETDGASKGLLSPPQTKLEAINCWKNDLLQSHVGNGEQLNAGAGESFRGSMEQTMTNNILEWRCTQRRDARIDLISDSLAQASTVSDGSTKNKKQKWPLSPAMKIVVKFSLRPDSVPPTSIVPTVSDGNSTASKVELANVKGHHYIGGLSFNAPINVNDSKVMTPHVYSVAGSHGDNLGVRSWLPTLDSASPNHRCSHELVVKVTSQKDEGLWPSASGEDFGMNQSVSHPILGNDASEEVFGPLKTECSDDDDELYQQGVEEAERVWNFVDGSVHHALGGRHFKFINDFFYGSNDDDKNNETTVPNNDSLSLDASSLNTEMLAQIRSLRPTYVTSMYSSLVWSPCPSRSLGFAIGPFTTIYDPEYFRLDDNDEDDSDDEIENDDTEDSSPLNLHETARKMGEGIRQLYFAPRDDRPWIHADVTDSIIFPSLASIGTNRQRPALTSEYIRDRKLLEQSVLASTLGVPNRALSLMRDILALPAYRTSSYTQIWIPNAQLSGSSSGGNMIGCAEVNGCNCFLGGAIIDSILLPPPGMRLPFYEEGRYLQFIQARNAIRGWIRAALPLGSGDDVGQSYLHCMVETFIMSLYERGHGAYGEGGGKGSYYYTKRYAIGSGLNSPNLDFLPLVNVEDDDVAGVVEEKGREHLWRSSSNGTETHTSSLDEFVIGQLLAKDFVEALERSDRTVPLPSMGWQGSHQSVTFLSNNSASSTALGCGALDYVHAMGGQMYRAMKTILLNRVYEGRAGITHLTRVIRAVFIASFLRDAGLAKLELPDDEKSNGNQEENADLAASKPPFLVCIEEMIKKKAVSHPIFTRSLRVMGGPIHEAYLRGNLVDIGRNNLDGRQARKLVAPEGFPNSYVRGASGLYLRVGAHVESADGSASSSATTTQSAAAIKGTHLHVIAEPVIPDGGTAFGGPVTLRVIENEGQCREFVKTIPEDGSRADWGPILLHNRSVSTVKKQQAASGIADTSTATAASGNTATDSASAGEKKSNATAAFSEQLLHKGGFQALELIRITNITPLLWVRIDPHGLYNGRINIMQQDACYAEQLFHEGDAIGQVEAARALAERPLKIQGTPKITNVHDVPIAELPVRVLGDCLRGSVALHSDLPHNPAVRSQAALAIAQWQNNKAPESRHVVGGSSWLGLDLLMQYFKERYYCNGNVLPVNFRRLVLHKHIAGVPTGGDTTSDGGYQYLDTLSEKDERENAIEFADEIEIEEDEEYRVRAACITAIASIRAKDGMTPASVVEFLEDVLVSGDKAAVGSLLLSHEEEKLKKKQNRSLRDLSHRRLVGPNDDDVSNLPYVSLSLVAEALLALCFVNARPQNDFDPTTGRPIQIKTEHPIVPLIKSCRSWLSWDLERERMRTEANVGNLSGVGEACNANIAPCAITALCHMALLKQCTTIASNVDTTQMNDSTSGSKRKSGSDEMDETHTAQFYINIFDDERVGKADSVRAAAAQAVACICCAADRIEKPNVEPMGLLLCLEFMLERILEPTTSPGLRLTLALLMMDACTGKICSLQRVGCFAAQGRLCGKGARFTNGPLGASCGGDNGSSMLLTVADSTLPAANAVNDGARRGLRLLKDPCKDGINQTQGRVARFASRLWRTMNGEDVTSSSSSCRQVGICAHDSQLRCQLVALWQWIWPRYCYQVMKSQSWHAVEGTPQYYAMGMDQVIKTTVEEKDAAALDDKELAALGKAVEDEIDKQKWRGEMSSEAYNNCKKEDMTGVGQPLPLVKKDEAWRLGGWVASTSQQRRAQGADGGSAVTKIRLLVSKS